ncbi:MAG: Holliday junction resolvase RuvX [Alphaproteobacteria bacterium]
MGICKPTDLRLHLAPGQRLMGLDVGEKTIGLAFSDPDLTVASPRLTLRRRKFTEDAAQISEFVRAENVGALVIGLPVNMDGSEGPRCQSTRDFASNLLEKIDIPVAFWDERLSTRAVEREMIRADRSRRKRARTIDSQAAAYILQGVLDRLRHG